MSKIESLYSLRASVVCGIAMVAFFFMLAQGAYASNSQVIIVNGTTNHCLPYLSCYKPYEIEVKPGDSVTWVNDDNVTHTATSGTPNYGPVGMFDSGAIPPGHSYTQFFGTVGRYTYYDQIDMWPSGVVVVSNQNPTHAEINWINGSLSLASHVDNNIQQLTMTKQIENTGGTDANSVVFRLRILNDSGFLFYDNITRQNVPAKQNAPVSFAWANPPPGKYRLNFDAENLAGQNNENNDVSSDLIAVTKNNASTSMSVVGHNFTINTGKATVPEFGQISYAILAFSIISVLVVSAKSGLYFKI